MFASAIVLCLILDSRQNDQFDAMTEWAIVLCLILDSRQNEEVEALTCGPIVLCLILDSRQNSQGYVPVAWLIVLCLILDSRQNPADINTFLQTLYCALFWIQGKTSRNHDITINDCTVPYFGFKAKLHFFR